MFSLLEAVFGWIPYTLRWFTRRLFGIKAAPAAAPAGKKVRIAVLECDVPMAGTREKYNGGFREVFKDMFYRGADYAGIPREQLEVTGYDVYGKQEYPNLDDVDAIILTGSRHDAFENDAWNMKLVEFCEKVLQQNRVRLSGICYGHQIIARAMGAEVGRHLEDKWELSVTDIKTTPRGKSLFGTDNLRLHHLHRDIVFQRPKDVEALGSTDTCAEQGMYCAKRLLTTQGHPEFNAGILGEVLRTRHERGMLDAEEYKEAMSRLDNEHDGVKVAAAIVKFFSEEGEYQRPALLN